jgi:hypothetical protein
VAAEGDIAEEGLNAVREEVGRSEVLNVADKHKVVLKDEGCGVLGAPRNEFKNVMVRAS